MKISHIVLVAIVAFSLGCSESKQSVCSTEIDKLLELGKNGWNYENCYIFYELSNGTIRVKYDGTIDLIIKHDSGPSTVLLSGYNSERASKIARMFGVSKMTPEEFSRSSYAINGLLDNVISEITNIVSGTNTIYEKED